MCVRTGAIFWSVQGFCTGNCPARIIIIHLHQHFVIHLKTQGPTSGRTWTCLERSLRNSKCIHNKFMPAQTQNHQDSRHDDHQDDRLDCCLDRPSRQPSRSGLPSGRLASAVETAVKTAVNTGVTTTIKTTVKTTAGMAVKPSSGRRPWRRPSRLPSIFDGRLSCHLFLKAVSMAVGTAVLAAGSSGDKCCSMAAETENMQTRTPEQLGR